MNFATKEEAAFPTLTSEHLELLNSCSIARKFPKGSYCYRQGETGYGLLVVTQGCLGVYEDSRGQINKVAEHKVGEFAGDIDLLTGRPSLVDMKAETDCEVLDIDRPCLKRIISQSPELGEIFLRAFLMRREILLNQGYVGITLSNTKSTQLL